MNGNPIDSVEALHSLTDLAGVMAFYVMELEKQKFTREEAVAIAIAWQHEMLSAPADSDDER